jgi:hypothetical protein
VWDGIQMVGNFSVKLPIPVGDLLFGELLGNVIEGVGSV